MGIPANFHAEENPDAAAILLLQLFAGGEIGCKVTRGQPSAAVVFDYRLKMFKKDNGMQAGPDGRGDIFGHGTACVAAETGMDVTVDTNING